MQKFLAPLAEANDAIQQSVLRIEEISDRLVGISSSPVPPAVEDLDVALPTIPAISQTIGNLQSRIGLLIQQIERLENVLDMGRPNSTSIGASTSANR